MYVPLEAINPRGATVTDEIKVEFLKPRDSSERIAPNGMLEKKFRLSVNQMTLFRDASGAIRNPKNALEDAGIHFPEGSAVMLKNPAEMFVRSTPSVVSLIDALMTSAKKSY